MSQIKIGILKRAIKIAEKSDYYPFKISAIIFKGNRILAEGKNYVGNSSRINKKYRFIECSIHAEADALSKLSLDDTKGASIIILRINAGSGKFSSAKPCEFCQKYIYEKSIKKVYASDENGELIEYRVINPTKKMTLKNENGENNYNDIFIEKVKKVGTFVKG